MSEDTFKNHRDALNDTLLPGKGVSVEDKKAICLQSIAHSLIDIAEQLSVIRSHLQK